MVVKVLRNVEVSAPVTGRPSQKSLVGITAIAPMPTIGKSTMLDAKTPKANALHIPSREHSSGDAAGANSCACTAICSAKLLASKN